MSTTQSGSIIVGPEAIAILTGTFLSGESPYLIHDSIPAMFLTLSGLLMSLYSITMPVLISTSTSEHVLLRQWRIIFDKGHTQGPALAVSTSVIYCYVAWARETANESGKPYLLAAALTMGIVPYTWVFMWRTNTNLFDAVDQSRTKTLNITKGRAEDMIKQWTTLHGVRSLFPLAGALVGLSTMLRLI